MKPSEILKQARDLIGTPGKWCKKTMARNQEGNGVANWDTNACAWCAVGACLRVCGDSTNSQVFVSKTPIYSFLCKAMEKKYGLLADTLAEFNDLPKTTHDMIMGLFNDAIQLAKEAGE